MARPRKSTPEAPPSAVAPVVPAPTPEPESGSTLQALDPMALSFEMAEAPPAVVPAPAPPVAPAPVAVQPTPPVAPAPAPAYAPDSALGTLMAARQVYEEHLRRTQEAEAGKGTAPAWAYEDPEDYDNTTQYPTLKSIWQKGGARLGERVVKHVEERVAKEIGAVRHEFAVRNLLRSDAFYTRTIPDYASKIQASGLLYYISNPKTGRPNSPAHYDPVLDQLLLQHPDPGQYAYELAGDILAGRTTPAPGSATPVSVPAGGNGGNAPPAAPGVSRARAAFAAEAAALEGAANRPQGIVGLPAARPGTRTLTSADIAAMSDADQTWLQKNRPDIWMAHKRQVFGLSP